MGGLSAGISCDILVNDHLPRVVGLPGEGMLRSPLNPLAAGRAWPPLPVLVRLVADHLHRAVVAAQGDSVAVPARRPR